MKRILFYIDMMYRGGAQRVMGNLAAYFLTQGWEVLLCNDFIPDSNISQYEVSPEIKRIYLAKTLVGNPIIKNIKRIYRLRQIIKNERPDCVISFLGRPNLRMLIATFGLKVKTIVSVRNDPNKEYGSGIKKKISQMLFCLADGCVFQTNDAKLYFPLRVQEKSTVILNPIENSFYLSSNKEKKDIITVGRLMRQKNHALLIEAFAYVANQYPLEKLIIYGDGPLKDFLQKKTIEKGLEKRIIFAGNVENIEEILKSAKMFVLSSDYEGLPNALMEAMAAGVPCISTDCPCGGPRMLIDNGENGILVPCNDVERLSKAISVLLESAELRCKISIAAQERAKIYKAEKIYQDWLHYIQEIMEN